MAKELEKASSPQGGDVGGTFKIDVSQGESIEAAKASIDPGYSLESTLEAGDIDSSCLVRGYCDYGVAIGEGKK
jgi:hypothetical protein